MRACRADSAAAEWAAQAAMCSSTLPSFRSAASRAPNSCERRCRSVQPCCPCTSYVFRSLISPASASQCFDYESKFALLELEAELPAGLVATIWVAPMLVVEVVDVVVELICELPFTPTVMPGCTAILPGLVVTVLPLPVVALVPPVLEIKDPVMLPPPDLRRPEKTSLIPS